MLATLGSGDLLQHLSGETTIAECMMLCTARAAHLTSRGACGKCSKHSGVNKMLLQSWKSDITKTNAKQWPTHSRWQAIQPKTDKDNGDPVGPSSTMKCTNDHDCCGISAMV